MRFRRAKVDDCTWLSGSRIRRIHSLARVIVNRIWQHLFGSGIVETVDNFGAEGQSPSHPELLDHLAGQLIDVVGR